MYIFGAEIVTIEKRENQAKGSAVELKVRWPTRLVKLGW